MAKEYNKIEARNNMDINNEEEVVKDAKKEPLKRVVSVEPKKVKKGLLSRLAVGVLGPEGLPGIGSYVADEIIKPAIKNLIVDSVTSGINKMMYGERGGPSGRGYNNYSQSGRGHHPQYTNYANRYAPGNQQPVQPTYAQPQQQQDNRVSAARYGVDEYIINGRNDASHVLISLTEHANSYGTVSVADYYDLIGIASEFTDNNYGWSAEGMARATIQPIRNGYVIKFPPVEVIG